MRAVVVIFVDIVDLLEFCSKSSSELKLRVNIDDDDGYITIMSVGFLLRRREFY